MHFEIFSTKHCEPRSRYFCRAQFKDSDGEVYIIESGILRSKKICRDIARRIFERLKTENETLTIGE